MQVMVFQAVMQLVSNFTGNRQPTGTPQSSSLPVGDGPHGLGGGGGGIGSMGGGGGRGRLVGWDSDDTSQFESSQLLSSRDPVRKLQLNSAIYFFSLVLSRLPSYRVQIAGFAGPHEEASIGIHRKSTETRKDTLLLQGCHRAKGTCECRHIHAHAWLSLCLSPVPCHAYPATPEDNNQAFQGSLPV